MHKHHQHHKSKYVKLIDKLTAGLDHMLLKLEQLWPKTSRQLKVSQEVRTAILTELQQQLKIRPASLQGQTLDFTGEEQELIRDIGEKTKRANRDNLSRTRAYFDFYRDHPEIHWAMLAHLVSRNGGYHMTDLKTPWLTHMLTQQQQEDFFHLLERCNWLIFQDAYPQLLLYAYSKATQKNRMKLLSAFHVSRLMIALWQWFLGQEKVPHNQSMVDKHTASKLLTYALIHNEQNYIEKRVIKDSFYKMRILDSWKFNAQSIFHLNHVVFPYLDLEEDRPQVSGLAVTHFDILEKRIEVGKCLYQLLFEHREISKRIQQWAATHQHTASRSDYWPDLFSRQPDGHAGVLKLSHHGLHQQQLKVYSPPLEQAWQVVQHQPAEQLEDWCQSERELHRLWLDGRKPIPQAHFTHEHLLALNEIELIQHLKP